MTDRIVRILLAFLGASLLSVCLIGAVIRIWVLDASYLNPTETNWVIGLLVALGAIASVRYAMWVDRSWRPLDLTKCRSCGYSLKGLKSNRFPECGTLFEKVPHIGD